MKQLITNFNHELKDGDIVVCKNPYSKKEDVARVYFSDHSAYIFIPDTKSGKRIWRVDPWVLGTITEVIGNYYDDPKGWPMYKVTDGTTSEIAVQP